MKLTEQRSSMLHGILLIALFSCAAFYIGDMAPVRALSLSPMIVGIVLGMIYANSLRNHLPDTWVPGIQFCAKRILRLGIILYGFRLTVQNITDVGLAAVVIDAIIVTGTLFIGWIVGRLLHVDRSVTLLTAAGSAICGAAAVLGVESAIRTKPYKTAVAVSTVVIFGTLSMFLYPALYRWGIVHPDPHTMGVYTGSTVHEVAHVVGAGNAMGRMVSDTAIIVKMIRVMMLVPVLLGIAYIVARRPFADGAEAPERTAKRKAVTIPWFAVGFLLVIAFNSLSLLPISVVDSLNTIDTFLLTMAMTALGVETNADKFRQAGFKPFILAAVLYVWLVVGGYMLCSYLLPILG